MTPKTILQKHLLGVLLLLASTAIWGQTGVVNDLLLRLERTQDPGNRLFLLDSITEQIIRGDHPQRWELLDENIYLARQLGNYDMAALKSRFHAQELIYQGKSDSAIAYVNGFLADSTKFTHPKPLGVLFTKRASALYHKQDFKRCLNDFERAAAIFAETGDFLFEADAIYFAGQIYQELGDFVKTVSYYQKAHALYDAGGDDTYVGYVRTNLANIYDANNFIEEANEERYRVIEMALERKEFETVAANYYYMSEAYEEIGDFERMKGLLELALQYRDSIPEGAPVRQIILFNTFQNRAAYYVEKNELPKAFRYLQRADSINDAALASLVFENDLLVTRARYFLKMGKPQDALKQVNALRSSTETPGMKRSVEIEKLLSEIYEQQNDPARALDHFRKYVALKDSSESTIKTNTLLFYQSQFESERKEEEIYHQKTTIQLLEKDKEIATNRRRALIAVLVSVVLFSIIVAYYIWIRGREKRNALARAFEKKRKELQQYTLELLRKSREHELLLQELSTSDIRLKEPQGEDLDALQELSSSRILTQDDWDLFKQKFIQVYPHFFVKLKKKGYVLTKSEERLLALEKLQLQTSEVANILGISPNSVITARYRLRKKINISKGASLADFVEPTTTSVVQSG